MAADRSVERIVRSTPGPEPVTEPEEVFLVDRVQHLDERALDDLVFQRRHRQRPLARRPVWVCKTPPARRRPIRPALDSVMQVRELTLEVCFVVPPR